MKTKTTILCLLAAAAAVTLPSCVDASYGGGGYGGGPGYRPGYVVQTLPPSHRVEVIGGTRYYYDNNVYYRPQGRGYVVVDNPHGHDRGGNRGPDRGPDRGHDWDRGPNRGNDRNDHDRDHGPGRGGRNDVTVIRKLPNGYKVVNHGGRRYYQSGGSYYQEASGGYVVVRKPF